MQELEKANDIPTQQPNEQELEIPFDFEKDNVEVTDEGRQHNAGDACKVSR
jgi:hypothetical protein